MLKTLALLALVGLTYAKAMDGKCCTFPEKMTTYLEGIVFDHTQQKEQIYLAKMYLDAKKGSVSKFNMDGLDIETYVSTKIVTVIPSIKSCTVGPLPSYIDIVNNGCFNDEKYYKNLGTRVYGQGNESLKATVYEKIFSDERPDTTFRITVTADSCIPVNQVTRGMTTGLQQTAIVGYTNVELDVKDDKVFDLPDYCNFEQKFVPYNDARIEKAKKVVEEIHKALNSQM